MANFDWNKFMQSREAKATGIGVGTALVAKLLGLGWGGSLATGAIAGGGYWGLDKLMDPATQAAARKKLRRQLRTPEDAAAVADFDKNEHAMNMANAYADHSSERRALQEAANDYNQNPTTDFGQYTNQDNEDKYNTQQSMNNSERMLLERAQADYGREAGAGRRAGKSAPVPYKNPFAARNAQDLAPEHAAKDLETYIDAVNTRAHRWAGYGDGPANWLVLKYVTNELNPNLSRFEKEFDNNRNSREFIDRYKAMAALRGHRINPLERLALERVLWPDRDYGHKTAPSFYPEYLRPDSVYDIIRGSRAMRRVK